MRRFIIRSKVLITFSMCILMMFIFVACGNSKDQKTNNDAQETASTEGIDITDDNFSNYAGTYQSEDGDSITISENGSVDISIFKLCSMQGTASAVYKKIMPIEVTDPADQTMELEFNTETKELYVIDSTWEYLENGDTFLMDK